MTWKPSPKEGVDPLALPLDARQGFLLSRLDGRTDLPTLALLTGYAEGEVAGLLSDLVALGAVATEGPVAAPRPAPPEAPAPEAEAESPAPEEPEPDAAEEEAATVRAATHRALFEQELHARGVDERVALAQRAEEPELSAYCFDPMPQVIAAVFQNPKVGPVHARLVAAHHRSTTGLEALAARHAFAQDGGVRRALLQNPLLPASLYRRLWSSRRLLEQYLVTTSRDSPEQIRAIAREVLRASFAQRTGEERVELILTTEGRCLNALGGLTIDGMTTALLCRRTYASTLLIQNIARWSAAPPQLIAHLRRQEIVRRNATLRQMLERHPNAS